MLHSARISKAEQACGLFVNRARAIDTVEEIRRMEDEDGITIWTIVAASLLDYDALEPVYKAELEAMRFVDGPVFDFRIVSAGQSESRSVEDLIPSRAKSIWKR